MPLYPTWQDITARLVLTLLTGAIIGFNRGVRGEAAGLRTTILVGLAASVSMILANLLLPMNGRTSDSFVSMDLMRLPLGILTGVGFIGGGTILKRGDLITGITTAATLWMMTVIGLCFGAGQFWLGSAATLLGAFVLLALKWVDIHASREHRARLVIISSDSSGATASLAALIGPMGYGAILCGRHAIPGEDGAALHFDVHWRQPDSKGAPLDLLQAVEQQFRISSFELASEIRH